MSLAEGHLQCLSWTLIRPHGYPTPLAPPRPDDGRQRFETARTGGLDHDQIELLTLDLGVTGCIGEMNVLANFEGVGCEPRP